MVGLSIWFIFSSLKRKNQNLEDLKRATHHAQTNSVKALRLVSFAIVTVDVIMAR